MARCGCDHSIIIAEPGERECFMFRARKIKTFWVQGVFDSLSLTNEVCGEGISAACVAGDRL
jgi:hypothetical protein